MWLRREILASQPVINNYNADQKQALQVHRYPNAGEGLQSPSE